MQVSKLKEELRDMDRTQKREGVDLTYLKNVTLKLLETGSFKSLGDTIEFLSRIKEPLLHTTP